MYMHYKESVLKPYKTAFRFANNKIIHLWSSVQNFNMNQNASLLDENMTLTIAQKNKQW